MALSPMPDLLTKPSNEITMNDLLTPGGQELIRMAQEARPTLDELVQARLKESATITTIESDEAQAVADAELQQVISLRKKLLGSIIKDTATVFHTLHRQLTGWIGAWDKLLDAREKSLGRALVDWQQKKEREAERERQRLAAIAAENARKEQERLRKEAEEKAAKELAEAELDRQTVLSSLLSYLGLMGEKKALQECAELAKRRSENINQVRQDTQAAREALESLSRGNTEEALTIMKFTKDAPPPPPPPPPRVETVAPAAVYVPAPTPPPSSLRGMRAVPKFEIICGHAKGNASESCPNCAKIERRFLVVDEGEVKRAISKLGEASGGTKQAPNLNIVPGYRVWWETDATLRRTP
jgi:hypothetical protein